VLKAEGAGPAFAGIMSNGTSGDVNNVDFTRPPPGRRAPYKQIRVVANDVAGTALEAYRQCRRKAR
jgi:hypothetical protein